MTDNQYLKALIAEGEGQRIEFKASFTTDCDREIVAFANAEGGSIFLGISDDGKVTGCQWSNKLASQAIDLARKCDPSISLEIIKHSQGVIELRVAEGQTKPYQCSRGFYIRQGASSLKVKQTELVELIRSSPNYHFDETVTGDCRYPKDVSPQAIELFLKRAEIKTKVEVDALLLSLDVAKESSSGLALRNAGVLFFAKNPQTFFREAIITCAKYEGTDKAHIEDRADCSGSIIDVLETSFTFVKRYIKRSQTIAGLQHKNVFNYPEVALREAIVNAVMHRDYVYDLSHIYINIFDDRIEIENPGGLPRGMSFEAIGQRSIRRNRLLADLLYRAGYVEKLGSGFSRMKKSLEDNGNPSFETQNGQFFLVRFFPNLGSKKSDRLTSRQQQILRQLAKSESLTAKEIAAALNVSPDTVLREIKVLKQLKLVTGLSSGKQAAYKLSN